GHRKHHGLQSPAISFGEAGTREARVKFSRSIIAMLAAAVTPTLVLGAPLKALRDEAPAGPAGGNVTEPRIRARFANLDAYLAYLEKRSHMDGAWYRQVRPGIYELQTGNLRLDGG